VPHREAVSLHDRWMSAGTGQFSYSGIGTGRRALAAALT